MHPTDGDIDRVRATALAFGFDYVHSICGIVLKVEGASSPCIRSGFLVDNPAAGPARILTAATNFYDAPSSKWFHVESANLTFSGDIDVGPFASASAIYVPNIFRRDILYQNDVAIIEVDRRALPPTCVPMALYDGASEAAPTEACHAGYGRFSTTHSPFQADINLYGGHTVVTYGRENEHPYFSTHLVSPYKTAEDINRTPENRYHFDPTLRGEAPAPRAGLSGDFIRMYQAHPEQSLLTLRGRGGPLMFDCDGIIKAAGVFSQTFFQAPELRWPDEKILMGVSYEPILPHLSWIRSPDLGIGGFPILGAASRSIEVVVSP